MCRDEKGFSFRKEREAAEYVRSITVQAFVLHIPEWNPDTPS